MLKKRILVLAGLLAFCIAGQVLLRPTLGSSEAALSDSSETPAEADGRQEHPPESDTAEVADDTVPLQSELLRQFFYMIGFVALIGIGAWLVCRKMSGRWHSGGGRTIQLGETVRMGPRKAVHLIHVGKKTFLVGSTADRLSLLADVSDSVDQTGNQSDE